MIDDTINFELLEDWAINYLGQKHKSENLENKTKGQKVKSEFKKLGAKIVQDFPEFLLAKCTDWQNSGYIYQYLWMQFKHKEYKNNPSSISIFIVKDTNKNAAKLLIETEIDEKNAKKSDYEAFSRALEKSTSFDNSWYWEDNNETTFDTAIAAINSLHERTSKKIKIVKHIQGPYSSTDSKRIINELKAAFKQLIPCYKNIYKYNEQIQEDNIDNKSLKFEQPKNQILYGPPGTGKTYNTVIKAIEITNPELIQRDKDGNVEKYETLKNKFEELKQQGQIEFVTFHQSYSYEEFVEGIKPDISKWNDDGSDIKYVGKDGIFKNIAKKALFSHLNILASDDEKFKNIIKCFIDDNSEGSKFKTQYSEFEIVRYTQTAIIVEPCNGKTEYNLTFNNLEKLYRNKQDVKTRKDIEQILGWRGLSTYYLAILNKLKDYSEKNITNIQTNSNEDSIIIKSIDDYLQEYYEGNLTLKEEPKKYILIIDEINRGDVSKIFGELITLIEEDKRIGKEHQMTVTLPYSREPFGVPNNLYIIGTMNTADRSIALLDTALRRRFDFEEMMPKPELLRGKDIEGVDLEQLLTKINDRIKNEYDRDHQIGHSYLMSVKDKEDLERAYKNRILPLLNEYFYNDINTVAKILNCKSDEITSKENWFNVLKEAQKPTKKDNEQ